MKRATAVLLSSLMGWIDGPSVKPDRAEAPLRVIRGTVVDPESRPVPGARVTIRNPARQVLSQAASGPSGEFELGLDEATELDATDIDVDIEAPGFAATHLVNFPRTPQLNCNMGRVRVNCAREIRGVVRSQDGVPVKGAKIHFWPYVKWCRVACAWANIRNWTQGEPLPDAIATTSTDGSFAFRELGPGLYNWAVSKSGFATATSEKYFVGIADTNDLAITLEPTTLTSARVVDTFGDPIEGVKVTVRFRTATTDKDGRFEFDGIPRAGEYVELQKLGFHTVVAPWIRPRERTTDTSSRSHTSQVYVMGSAPIVRLTFDASGNAAPSVRSLKILSMRPTGWSSLSERELAIDRSSPSQWLVECPVAVNSFIPMPELFGLVTADGGGWSTVLFDWKTPDPQPIPPPSKSRQFLDYRVILTPPATISGSLTGQDGNPIAGAWVVATLDCEAYASHRYGTWSRPDGGFDLTFPKASFCLTASLPEHVVTLPGLDSRYPATPGPFHLKASDSPAPAFPHSLERDRSIVDFQNLDEE